MNGQTQQSAQSTNKLTNFLCYKWPSRIQRQIVVAMPEFVKWGILDVTPFPLMDFWYSWRGCPLSHFPQFWHFFTSPTYLNCLIFQFQLTDDATNKIVGNSIWFGCTSNFYSKIQTNIWVMVAKRNAATVRASSCFWRPVKWRLFGVINKPL